MCLAFGQAYAYDFAAGGILYKILSNTNTRKTVAVTYATTTPDASGYITTYKGDVVIPAQASWNMQTFNVTQIGDLAMFNNQSVYSVTLPEGVSAIGNQTFSHCYSMEYIVIPSTLTRIGDYAFEYCEDLTTISLPANLGMIGDGAFQQCYGLQSINVDEENLEFKSVEGVLFSGKSSQSGMTLFVYPGSRPDPTFSVPEGTKAIDPYALSANTTLKNLILPASLKTIGAFAFSECYVLEFFEVKEGNENFSSYYGVLFNADKSTLIQYPCCRPYDTYEVPDGVATLGEMSFSQMRTITDLTLPATLRHIEPMAFFANDGLQTITCKAEVPPTWSTSPIMPSAGLFESAVYQSAILRVPAASVEAYRKASGWSNFRDIVAIDDAAVSTVEADSTAPVESFDLQGRAADSSARGIIIERRGNTITKTLRR